MQADTSAAYVGAGFAGLAQHSDGGHADDQVGDHGHDHDHGKVQRQVAMPPNRVFLSRPSETLTGPAAGKADELALKYLNDNAAELGLTQADLKHYQITDKYVTAKTGTTHIYLQQQLNGLPIENAYISVNVLKDGRILNAHSSFMTGLNQSQSAQPMMSATSAFQAMAMHLGLEMTEAPRVLSTAQGTQQTTVISKSGIADEPVKARLQYVPVGNGVELAWRMNMITKDLQHAYDVSVSASSGQVLSLSDGVSHATYNVFPMPLEGPHEGNRVRVVDPADPLASPFGWHDVNGMPGPDFFDTRGNNVFAQEDFDGDNLLGRRPSGGPNLVFDFPFDVNQMPQLNEAAAITNAFYWLNVLHDVHFQYGFDEASGNFQSLNYSGLGQGGDPVILDVLDGGGGPNSLNNAFFMFQPDGISPRIGMGLFNFDIISGSVLSPERDTAFANDVLIHEFGHGVSLRLTGGPAVVGLGTFEAASMGEGWSDFHALILTQKASDTPAQPRVTGDFLSPSTTGQGVRRFPYSFDKTINPLTWRDYNPLAPSPHSNGEIWSSALWDMNWLLIQKYGFDSDLYRGTGGNNLAMQLVMDGMKLQPVNPTYLQARNAILQADLALTGGLNHDAIWEAFARRGMGFSASDANGIIREAFDIPRTASTVQGVVFQDSNSDGTRNVGEPGLSGWTVYVDANKNGQLDPLEPTTTSAADGSYSFKLFAPGVFTIGQVLKPNFVQTFPSPAKSHSVTVAGGQTVTGLNFGNRTGPVDITGVKFHDIDGNGVRDAGEPGVEGVFIYIDLDDDSRADFGEPASVTDADGKYVIKTNKTGTFKLREIVEPGWTQTFPAGDGSHSVTLGGPIAAGGFDFGNQRMDDHGDAPAPYPTLNADNGAVHGIQPGFFLGAGVDSEGDGLPDADALGDDNNNSDDEDGVQFTSQVIAGRPATVDVTAAFPGNTPGILNAWVDFNRDGDWSDAGEQIFTNRTLAKGLNSLTFAVPAGASVGDTFARFRYSYDRNVQTTGRGGLGEVEDYRVRLVPDKPVANNDSFRVAQNSADNRMDVLANDLAGPSGRLTITGTSSASAGGTVTISPDQRTVQYTPPANFIGNDTFAYTVTDGDGNQATAQVTVVVEPKFDNPIALDDSFIVQEDTTLNPLDVLNNDISGKDGPITIISASSPANGVTVVDRNGTADPSDDVIRYTPIPSFGGTDQFTYTIEDKVGQTSTATVTVQVEPGASQDDDVSLRLVTTDLAGTPLSTVAAGSQFQLQVLVKDLRTNVPDPGVFAAYLDVLYDSDLVSVVTTNTNRGFDITYSQDYNRGQSGDASVPGLIDEVGSFQSGNSPLGSGEFLMFTITMNANAPGQAEFIGDPADDHPSHDVLLFQPPEVVDIPRVRYIRTSLEILGTGTPPKAVEDSAFVVAASANQLNVLANDIEENGNPLTITSVVQPRNGTASIDRKGTADPSDDVIVYTPNAQFTGSEQFKYTIRNDEGLADTATVTVHVQGGSELDDKVRIRLEVTDMNGVPQSTVQKGADFQLRAFVEDNRTAPNKPGVFAAYLDTLYNRSLVTPVSAQNTHGFEIQFGPDYSNGKSGKLAVPGLLDEVGAFQGGSNNLGSGEFLLFAATFKADANGAARFAADPADIHPSHDVLLFEPPSPVPFQEVHYGQVTVMIVDGGSFTNTVNPLDVNADGFVSPIDALFVINDLNQNGARGLQSGAEGESAQETKVFLDVNSDGYVSPIDALAVINYLNSGANAESEPVRLAESEQAEGEFTAFAGEALQPLAKSPLSDQQPLVIQAAGLPTLANSSDRDDATLNYQRTSSTKQDHRDSLPVNLLPVGDDDHEQAVLHDTVSLVQGNGDADDSWLNELAEDVGSAWARESEDLL